MLMCGICYAAETPITLIIPFSAGGPMDVVARIVQQGLAKETGRVINIVNKSGAGGIIAVNYAIEQKNSGTVLLIHSGAFFINHILNRPAYNLSEEFKLISDIGYHPFVLISNEKFQYQNLKEWSTLKGKHFSISNGGTGTTTYVANKLFENYFPNIDFIHVSYSKGVAMMTADIMSGIVDLSLAQVSTVNQLVSTKKVQALAVASKKRLDNMPDVPTFREVGINNFNLNSPYLLFGINSTNDSELLRMRAAMSRVLDDPEIHTQFKTIGIEREPNVNLDNFIAIELPKYEKLLKNIK